MRRAVLLGAAASGVLALPAAASAHIDVLPTRVVQGEPAQFTVRVPTEREIPTVAVRVDFPPQVTVYALGPPPAGFTMRPRRSQDGRIVGVVYRGRIPTEQYRDFTFLGTPFDAGTTVWRSFQTYADGQVKPWSAAPAQEGAEAGESGPTDPGPAAAVEVLPEGASLAPVAAATGGGGDDGSDAGIWLGVIAVALSAGALVATGFLWSTRPMDLPPDDPAA